MNREALKEIEKQIADAGYVYDDFLDICKEALEKQIPKKINNADGFGGRCPVCGYYDDKRAGISIKASHNRKACHLSVHQYRHQLYEPGLKAVGQHHANRKRKLFRGLLRYQSE